MKQSQKLRIVCNQVSVYTTVKAVIQGIGDFIQFNTACQEALAELEHLRTQTIKPIGLVGTFKNLQIQINLI